MKLTPEQKLIELAKMDGWLDVMEYKYDYDYAGDQGSFKQIQGRQPGSLHEFQALNPIPPPTTP